ncbi:hypothetical protein FRB90_000023 [Tulasnella sp. 427]|nr:hypothetical protein FRB90_000023 [Tulasnella sp. 427]
MPAARTPKTATTSAKKASKRDKKDGGEPKEKRPPSPYNLFVKEQMPIWKQANPGRPVKEAMQEIAALWAESDLNANKGKPSKSKAKKKSSKASDPAEEASSSAAGSSSAVPSSDHDD